MIGAALPALIASPLGAIAAHQLDGVFGHLLGTAATASGGGEKARILLDRILRRRRVLPGVPAEPTEAARDPHGAAMKAPLATKDSPPQTGTLRPLSPFGLEVRLPAGPHAARPAPRSGGVIAMENAS